jgi:hypothetical protein
VEVTEVLAAKGGGTAAVSGNFDVGTAFALDEHGYHRGIEKNFFIYSLLIGYQGGWGKWDIEAVGG